MHRILKLLAAGLATLALTAEANAPAKPQWPEKPVRIVVPFGPASFPDIVARVVGQKLSEGLGQPVVIENKPGAGGNIGTEAVVRAKPDGYTLLLHTVANAINASLYRSLPFDASKDLVPVSQIASVSNVLVVPTALPVNSLKELIELARTSRRGLTFASGGNGTTAHLAGQLFKTMAQVKVEHVPYSNFGQALTDVMGGQPDFIIPNIPPTVAHIQGGKFRAIAVTGVKRSALLPEVPTFAEAGLSGYEVSSWNGLAAPAGTPPEVIARLHTEVVKALKDPEVAKKLTAQGAEIVGSTPAAYAALIHAETTKWRGVVRDAGALVD